MGLEPPHVGVVDDRFGRADALQAEANISPNEPFGTKNPHLRIVCDGPKHAVEGHEVTDAARAEAADDVRSAFEFHRRAQGVADRAAKQAAADSVLSR